MVKLKFVYCLTVRDKVFNYYGSCTCQIELRDDRSMEGTLNIRNIYKKI